MTDYLGKIHGHYVSGRAWSTGLHITSSETPSAMLTTWTAAVTDFWTNGSHGIQTLYHTDTILDSVEVLTLDGTLKQTARQGPSLLSLAGTSSDTAGADIDSVVVSLRTAHIGKGEIGHMKLPSVVEGAITNGELAPTPQARIGAAATALLAAINADGSTVFLANRQVTISKPTLYTKSIVTSAKACNIIGTVRKRVSKAVRTYA